MVYSHSRKKGVGMHRLVGRLSGRLGGECEIAYSTVHHGIKADSLPCGTNAWETHRIGDPSSFLVIDGHEVFAAHFLCSIAKHKFST